MIKVLAEYEFSNDGVVKHSMYMQFTKMLSTNVWKMTDAERQEVSEILYYSYLRIRDAERAYQSYCLSEKKMTDDILINRNYTNGGRFAIHYQSPMPILLHHIRDFLESGYIALQYTVWLSNILLNPLKKFVTLKQAGDYIKKNFNSSPKVIEALNRDAKWQTTLFFNRSYFIHPLGRDGTSIRLERDLIADYIVEIDENNDPIISFPIIKPTQQRVSEYLNETLVQLCNFYESYNAFLIGLRCPEHYCIYYFDEIQRGQSKDGYRYKFGFDRETRKKLGL